MTSAVAELANALQATPVRSSGLVRLSLEELAELEIPERPTILGPVLRGQDLVMVHGPRGVGKTYFVTSLAIAAAGGGSVFGWKAPLRTRVLFVDGELPVRVLRDRLSFAVVATGADPGGHLDVVPYELQPAGFESLATLPGQRALEQHLNGVGLLVIDSISTLCRGGEENSAESWENIQAWLLSLRRRGLAVILVHHSGKSGQQRGTSKREDVLDLVLGLKHPPDYVASQGCRMRCTFEKARGLFGADVDPLEIALDTDPAGRPVWTHTTVAAAVEDQVVALALEGLTGTEIAQEVGRHKSSVSRMLKAARVAGRLG